LAAFVERGSLLLRLLVGGGKGVVNERAVAVDARELTQDCGLKLLARDALTLAGFGTVLLAGGAGVVVGSECWCRRTTRAKRKHRRKNSLQ
jgi:hypothetical protein